MATAEIVPPYIDHPNEGFMSMSVEYSSMAAPGLSISQRSDISQPILRILEKSIKETRAIDLEALCIVAGSKVWAIKVDVHILDDCGSVLDACSLAAMGSLLHLRKPDVTITGDNVTVHSFKERIPVPLSIHHIPLATSLVFVPAVNIQDTSKNDELADEDNDDEDVGIANMANNDYNYRKSTSQHRKQLCTLNTIRLIDPTEREEQVAVGKLIIVSNSHKEVCGVYKSGAPGLIPKDLTSTIDAVLNINAELCSLLQKRMP